MPRFAANLSFLFGEWTFADRFSAAADAGFPAVECIIPPDFTPEAMARALERNGLVLANFNACTGDFAAGDRGLAAIGGRLDEFRRGLDLAADYIAAGKAEKVHIMAGSVSSTSADARSAFERSMRLAVERLASSGAEIVVEPINARDMPGYFLDDFDAAVAWIERIGSIRLLFDVYHRQIMHGDVTMALRRLAPLIGHIQIASVPGRNEPDRDELNLDHILKVIDDLPYHGYVACEYRPSAGTLAGLGWMDPWLRHA